MSCSQPAAPSSQGEVQTAKELYDRQESYIAECMAKAGFDYVPDPFLELAPANDPVTQNIMVADPEFGYGAVYLFVLGQNQGDPLGPVSKNEQEAYSAALVGSPEESMTEDGLFEPGGCVGEADFYMRETYADVFYLLDWSDRWQEVQQELQTREDFAVFSERWNACMNRNGVTPLSPSPIDHNYDAFYEFYKRIPSDWRVAAEEPDPLTDKTSYLQAIAALPPELEEIYSDEVAAATLDHECRLEASVGLEAMLEDFGVTSG